jgi:hypothetical protein
LSAEVSWWIFPALLLGSRSVLRYRLLGCENKFTTMFTHASAKSPLTFVQDPIEVLCVSCLDRTSRAQMSRTKWYVDDSNEYPMLNGLKITVIMPAYNAAATLKQTYDNLPKVLIDDVILTDNFSTDNTVEVSHSLGIHTILHTRNKGYGANQKTCYDAAIARGTDIVVMLHPDYQYSPRLAPAIVSVVASGEYDFALGSRILGKGALAGGMPLYKYVSNRFLTFVQNLLIGQKMSEYIRVSAAGAARRSSPFPITAALTISYLTTR